MARRLPANVLRDDLLSAGMFGLIDSLRRNGGDKGESFEGYARARIRGAIFDELRAQDWVSRRARDTISRLTEDVGQASLISLSEETTLEEAFLAAETPDPHKTLEERSQFRVIAWALSQLSERERQVIVLYYLEGLKLREIGTSMKVSEPRISQIHSRALSKLRRLIERRGSASGKPNDPAKHLEE